MLSSKHIPVDTIVKITNPFGIKSRKDSVVDLGSRVHVAINMDHVHEAVRSGRKVCINHRLFDLLDKGSTFENVIHGDTGTAIQRNMAHAVRKNLAANFTDLSAASFIGKLAKQFENKTQRVADPFAGSGRLLREVQRRFSRKLHLFACEIYPHSVLATFATMLELIAEDRALTATVFYSDAFDLDGIGEKFDMVVMNPPFTRRHRLSEGLHKRIRKQLDEYQDFLQGQPGLHVYSMFLADRMLRKNGTLIAVLPAATFSSDYSKGLLTYLLENYRIQTLITPIDNSAFSDGSRIREVILVATKTNESSTQSRFILVDRNGQTNRNFEPIHAVELKQDLLKHDWNWLRHFHSASPDLGIPLYTIADLGIPLIRGLEMYGPDFFILPNRNWDVIQDNFKTLTIQSKQTKKVLALSKSHLIPVLRKPSYYKGKISPVVKHWMIALPPNQQPHWIEDYVRENGYLGEPAKKNFGEVWLNHVHRQMMAKNPFGHLFVVDKFGFKSVGTFVHFLDHKVSATKNFYLFKASYEQSKLLGAWLSSSLFLHSYLRARRIIGRDLGRLQISDYKKEPLFVDINAIDTAHKNLIIQRFDELRHLELPKFKQQLDLYTRLPLDEAWITWINEIYGLNLNTETIYNALSQWF